jgi:hypothetical protein
LNQSKTVTNPIPALKRMVSVIERTATAMSVLLLVGTASYLAIHTIVAPGM